jgi:DNA-directed RNA polymerase specialized sigma24 family protein
MPKSKVARVGELVRGGVRPAKFEPVVNAVAQATGSDNHTTAAMAETLVGEAGFHLSVRQRMQLTRLLGAARRRFRVKALEMNGGDQWFANQCLRAGAEHYDEAAELHAAQGDFTFVENFQEHADVFLEGMQAFLDAARADVAIPALEELVTHQQQMLITFASMRTGNTYTGQDIVFTTFVRMVALLRYRASRGETHLLTDSTQVKAMALTIIRNGAIDEYRRNQRTTSLEGFDRAERLDPAIGILFKEAIGSGVLTRWELAARLMKGAGFDLTEIAEYLNRNRLDMKKPVTSGNAGTIRRRALVKLRRKLGRWQ